MEDSYPKITIVTPNYNCGQYLEETILSVINQNYPNLEYIIIDGGSSDNSVDIIKKYEDNLAFWISEPDSGMYEAIQKGFDKSNGEIMAWINSDDLYHPNALFTVAEIFSQFKEINWLTGCNTLFDEEGKTVKAAGAFPHTKYSFLSNVDNDYIQQESTFWRRNVWDKAGAYVSCEHSYAGDFELWTRFFRIEQLHVTNALIGGFRSRDGQITQVLLNEYEQECEKILHKENADLSFYDKCLMKKIMTINHTLETLPLTKKEMNLLKNNLDRICKKPNTVHYDQASKTFKQGLNPMGNSDVLKAMTKKRDSLKDTLLLLKEKQSYYPEVILDIGVANGTPELYEIYPCSHFILFEALKEFMPAMEQIKSTFDNVDIELCALGANNGNVEFNVHPDLVGSSLYTESDESDVNGSKRTVKMSTLDKFISTYDLSNKSILAKIDVQGAELDVLNGAKEIIDNIDVIVLEVSLFNFFNNDIEFFEIVEYMKKRYFVVYDILGTLNRPLDGALAQVDLVFVKEKSQFRKEHVFATEHQRSELNKHFNNKSVNFQEATSSSNFDFSVGFNRFFETINQCKESKLTYLLYGNGTVGKTVFSSMESSVVGSVDAASKVISTEINPSETYSVENIKNMKFDKILITVLGREAQIRDFLVNNYNIPNDDIIEFNI